MKLADTSKSSKNVRELLNNINLNSINKKRSLKIEIVDCSDH